MFTFGLHLFVSEGVMNRGISLAHVVCSIVQNHNREYETTFDGPQDKMKFLTCRWLFAGVDKIISFHRPPEPPLPTLSTAPTASRSRSRPLRGLRRSYSIRAHRVESLRYGEEARAKAHRAFLDVVRDGLCVICCMKLSGVGQGVHVGDAEREGGRKG